MVPVSGPGCAPVTPPGTQVPTFAFCSGPPSGASETWPVHFWPRRERLQAQEVGASGGSGLFEKDPVIVRQSSFPG